MAQNLRMARAIRVVGEARCGDIGSCCQDRQHSRVQSLSARLGQRILERAPGQLVPEGQRTLLVSNHSDAQATVDSRLVETRSLFQQPRLRLSGYYQTSSAISRAAGEANRARQHRIAHGGRHRRHQRPNL
jgi:hypothetical protein